MESALSEVLWLAVPLIPFAPLALLLAAIWGVDE
jgi:hypothetical protein